MRLRPLASTVLAAAMVVGASLPASAIAPPGAPGCPVFPSNNIWRADITKLPIHSKSAAWLASMGAATKKLHPDFGPSGTAMPYGIPYIVVAGSHPKVTVDFTYADESDPGPYPFGSETPIEGGSDRHALMIDKDTCKLYELYAATYAGNSSTAGSGAIWSLKSNALRPAGWTSADAAGLPVFAGLVRLDEVKAGVVDHAIRVTASVTDTSYLWPARHQAGAASNSSLPPMGARFRLKASYSISGFRSDTKVILTAMKRYGMMLADNGSDWFFTGTAENGWNTDMLDELKTVPGSAFEAVDESSLMVNVNSGQVKKKKTPPPPPPTAPKPKPKPTTSSAPAAAPSATPTPSPKASASPPRPPAGSVPSSIPSLSLAARRDTGGPPAVWSWLAITTVVALGVLVAWKRRRPIDLGPDGP